MAWTSTNANTRLALGQTSTLKTINGISLLGDGDITVATSAAGSGNEVQYRANDGTFAAALGSSVDTLGVATLSGLKLASGSYPTYLDTQYIPTYNFLALTRNGNNVGLRVAEFYSSTGSTNKVMAHPTYGLRIASDRALEFSSTSEVTGSADAKITRATGPYIKVQADSGFSVRNLADTQYASGTALAWYGSDYVQGATRVLVGNSSGGRLLPGTDGVLVYNWAQSGLGYLHSNDVRIGGTPGSPYGLIKATTSGQISFRNGGDTGSANIDAGAISGQNCTFNGNTTFGGWFQLRAGSGTVDGLYFGSGHNIYWNSSSTINTGGLYDSLIKQVSGPAVQVQAAGGLNVKNLAGSADAPVTASRFNILAVEDVSSQCELSDYFSRGIIARGNDSSSTNTLFRVNYARTSENPLSVYRNRVDTTVPVNVTSGTVTASTPALNVSQTWNNAAVAFTGIKSNITDTLSANGSLLLDLQVGSVSKFSVDKYGNATVNNLTVNGTSNITATPGGSSGQLQYNNGTTFAGVTGSVVSGSDLTLGGSLSVGSSGQVRFGSSSLYPKLKRSGSGLEVVRQDDVGYSDITAENLLANNAIGVNNYLQFGYGLGYGGRLVTKTDGLQLQDWAGVSPGYLHASETRLGGTLSTPNARVRATASNTVEIRSGDGLSAGALSAAAGTFSGLNVGTTTISTIAMGNASIAQFVGALYLGSASGQMVHLAPSGTARLSIDSASCTIGVPLTVQSSATIAAGTVTTSTPIINATQTWNNVATTFTGHLLNITDTASAATSKLLDLQVGSVSKFSVDKAGNTVLNNLTVNGTHNITVTPGGSSGNLQYNNAGSLGGISGSAVSGSDVTFGGNVLALGSLNLGNTSVGIANILDNIIAISPNGLVVFDGSYVPKPVSASQFSTNVTPTSNAPSLYAVQTWNNVAVPFTLMYGNVTDTASASTSNLIDLQVGATSKFKVDKSGNQTLSGNLSIGTSGQIKFGSSSSFPMLQRTGLGIEVKRQDNAAYSDIYAENVLANNALQATAYIQMGSSSGARLVQGTDGVSLLNFAGTAPGYLHSSDLRLGGTTGSPNGLLRSTVSGTVEVRNGSDSAAGNISAAAGTFTGAVTVGNTSVSSMVLGNASIAQVGGNVFIASGSGASINLMPSGTTRFSVDSASCTIQPPLTVQNSVTITAGTATTSTPVINATQTWNSGVTTFKAITLDVTDTTSASASKFLDFSLGGTSKFSVDKNGNVSLNNLTVNGTHNITMTATPGGTSGQIQYNNGGSLGGMNGSTISGSNMTLTGTFGATSATLTGGTITTSTPAVTATQTWNNVATTFTGISLDVTDTASASGSKLLDLMVGSSTKFSVDKAGNTVTGNQLTLTPSDTFGTTRITAGNYGTLSLGLNGGYLAVAGTSSLLYTASQFSPVNTGTIDLGQTGTRFKNAYFTGPIATSDNGSASIDVPSGTINGYAMVFTNRLRANSGTNFEVLASSGDLKTVGGIGFHATAATSGFTAKSVLSSTAWQIQADGGLTVKNLAGSADAALTALTGTFSGGTVTASTPVISVSQTWNNVATTFTGITSNVTDTASAAASKLIDLQVGGTSKFSVKKDGSITVPTGSTFSGDVISCGSVVASSYLSTFQLLLSDNVRLRNTPTSVDGDLSVLKMDVTTLGNVRTGVLTLGNPATATASTDWAKIKATATGAIALRNAADSGYASMTAASTFVGSDVTNYGYTSQVFGRMSLADNTTLRNVFLNGGNATLTGTDNLILSSFGSTSGTSLTSGSCNTAVGNRYANGVGGGLTSGSDNSFFGSGAGYCVSTGNDNVMMGYLSGFNSLSADSNNTYVGAFAGYGGNGSSNVYIGNKAGRAVTGSNNIHIGIGSTSTLTESNKLRIGPVATPIIDGNLSTNAININGAATFSSTGTFSGSVTATTFTAVNGSTGRVMLVSGDATYSGYIEWRNPANSPKWYMGYDSGNDISLAPFASGSVNIGTATYTGSVKLIGSASNATVSVSTGSSLNIDKPLSVTGGTVTASTPIFNGTQTWNSAGVTFNGIFQNITDTSSAAASKLIDLQVGGSSKFNVTKAGTAVFTGTVTAGDSTFGAVYAGTSRLYHLLGSVALESASGSVDLSPAGVSKFNVNSTDVTASAPFTVYAGTATASASIFNGTQTWNNGAVTFTAIKANVTDTASASGSKLLDLQVGSVSKFSVDKAGNTVLNNLTVNGTHNITSLPAGSSGNLQYNNAGVLGGISGSSVSGSDVTLGGNLSAVGLTLSGNVTLASTSRINFGTSAAYPELRRTSNRLEVLRYDGTGYQDLWVNNLEAINDVTASTGDIGVLTTSSTSATVFTGAGGTVTTSTPVLDVSQTWNAGAVAFTLASFNATATAAANGSKLLRVGTAGDIAEIAVQKVASAGNHTAAYRLMFGGALSLAYSPELGALTLRNAANTAAANFNANAIAMQEASVNSYITVASWVEMGSSSWRGTNRAITIANTGGVHWTNTSATSGTADIGLNRNAAGVLEVNSGTTNAYRDLKLRSLYAIGGTITTSTPSIDVTQTWNSGATTFTAIKTDITDTASAAASKLIDLQVGSVSKFSVDKAGNTVLNNLTVNGTHNITSLPAGSSGNLQYNNAGVTAGVSGSSVSGSDIALGGNLGLPSTGELQFGTTSTYPKLRRVANRLEVYRYDGTGYQDLWANNLISITSVGSMGEVFATTNVSATLDVVAGRDIVGVATSELQFGTAAKIKQSSNVIYFQSDSGATFRDYAGTGYSSATGSAFYATDYVQGAQRILIGSSSGGRLLPGTNGIQVYNWAQSALGSVTSNQNVITGGTVTASTPVIDATQTWNSAGTTFTGIKLNVTDTTSAAASKLVDLQVGAVSKFSVDKAGNTVVNNLTVNGTHNITVAAAGSSGNLQYNNAGVTAGVSGSSVSGSNVTVGGTVTATNYLVGSSTGPLIKNNSGAIRLRDYLDSSYANLEAGTGTFNGGATATTFTAVNGSTGRVAAVAGDATYSGYIEWRNPANSPKWYMGYDSGNDLTLAPFASGTFNIGTATYTGSVKLIGSSSNAVISVSSGSALLIDKATTISGVVSATAATLATGTITSSTPAVNVTQTWNSVGTTFAGIFSNITDTASAAASKLLDLQVGSVSKFSVDKAGNTSLQNLTVNGTHNITSLPAGSSGQLQFNSGGTLSGMTGSSVSSNNLTLTGTLGFSTATATGGTVTTSTPVFSGTQTWNNAGGTFTGISLAVTDTASGSGSRLVSMTVGGNSMFAISKAGSVTAPTFSASNTDVSNGSMVIAKGDGSNTGYLEWRNQAGTRKWYMGYDSTNDLTLMPESSGSLKIGSASYTGSIKLVGSASTATIASSTGNTVTIDKSVSVTGSVAGTYATMTTGTITSSTPAIDVTQTWNSAGVTFTGIKSNITDTASAAASKLLDLQVGSVSKFSVDKAGNTSLQNLTVNGTHNITANPAGSSGQLQFNSGGTLGGMTGSSVSSNNLTLTGTLGFSTATSTGGTVTTSTPMFSGTQTWNNVATTFTGILTNVTDTTSASASLLMDLQVGSVSKFSVDKSGTTTSAVFYSGAGSIGVPGIMIGEASTGFYRNAASTLRMTLGGTVPYGWNLNGFETTGYIGFTTASPGSGIHDALIARNNTGPTIDVRTAGGLKVRNFAGTNDAPLTASAGTFSSTVAVSDTTVTGDRFTFKDGGGTTWTLSTGGVASTDGFRFTKLGVADIVAFRPSVSLFYTPLTTTGLLTATSGLFAKSDTTWADANIPTVTVQNTATSGSRTAVIKAKIDTGYTGSLPELWMGAETATSGITGTFVRTVSNHPMIFYTNDVKRFELTAAGHIVPSTTNVTDLGLTGTRFKDAYLQGTVYSNGFNAGNGSITVHRDGPLYFGSDALVRYNLPTTAVQAQAASGLKVRNYADSADAPITASNGIFTNKAAIGTSAVANAMLYISDSQPSFYPTIAIDKHTWGSPLSLSWATESAGITSTGAGALFSHIQTITTTALANSPINGGGLDVRCEYDQPYVAGLYVRGRKTRTDAPTHPNLAYGIYAVANSGKASGLGGAAGYFLCETANVAGVQIRAAASQAQSLLLVQDSAAATLFSVDQTGNVVLNGYSGLTVTNGSCVINQDGVFQIGTHAKLKRATNDLKVCAPVTYFRNYADSADAAINAGAATLTGQLKLPVDTQVISSESQNRIYFANSSHTYYAVPAGSAHVFREGSSSNRGAVEALKVTTKNNSSTTTNLLKDVGGIETYPQGTTDAGILVTMPASSTAKALEVIMSATSNFSVSSSGVVISKFDTKAGAVVVGDLATSTIRTIKDTSGGKTRIYINDGGTLKQSMPFIADAGSTGWSISNFTTHKTLDPTTTTMTELINFIATLAQRLKDLGAIDA